jgi:UDP:flavonoid glycosyltransferase YjiC (YdhE family)
LESFIFGKPILGIPISVDQFFHAERLTKQGYGENIRISSLPKDFNEKIEKLLNEEKYMKKLKEASKIMNFYIQDNYNYKKFVELMDMVFF